jgi:unsaturated rhamnogalacturonyl hydrolase
MAARLLLTATLLAATLPSVAAAQSPARPAAEKYYVQMARAVMQRKPEVHHRWDYVAGLVLLSIDEVGRRTGDARYAQYVKRNMDQWVQPDGSITGYKMEDYNSDQVNQGKLLFRLYDRTRDERYRKAAMTLREQMRRHPRTSEGGFWHKQTYPGQMWLDGAYMTSPFLAQYASAFREPALYDDVARQLLLLARHNRDPKTGLFYHGWDESRTQAWADSVTGLSANFWGRAVGWYAMALVDVLDFLPPDHPDRQAIIGVFRELAAAIVRVQDPVTGLWYQVLDQPNRKGNYHEASATSMFTYALAKGARKGYLQPAYRAAAERAYDGMVRSFVKKGDDGLISLDRINEVAGLGGAQQRSGSFDYYIGEPVVMNDYKGVGPFILASLELNR